jgi:hypothetical protein
MLVNPFEAWRRPARQLPAHCQPGPLDVEGNDSILTGVTAGSLATERATQTPMAVDVFASGHSQKLSGTVPFENLDGQQRHRLASESPPDDRLCGEVVHFLRLDSRTTVIYGGYENGEPTRRVVSFADRADEVALEVGKMLSLESSAGPTSEHGAIHAQGAACGD